MLSHVLIKRLLYHEKKMSIPHPLLIGRGELMWKGKDSRGGQCLLRLGLGIIGPSLFGDSSVFRKCGGEIFGRYSEKGTEK